MYILRRIYGRKKAVRGDSEINLVFSITGETRVRREDISPFLGLVKPMTIIRKYPSRRTLTIEWRSP